MYICYSCCYIFRRIFWKLAALCATLPFCQKVRLPVFFIALRWFQLSCFSSGDDSVRSTNVQVLDRSGLHDVTSRPGEKAASGSSVKQRPVQSCAPCETCHVADVAARNHCDRTSTDQRSGRPEFNCPTFDAVHCNLW